LINNSNIRFGVAGNPPNFWASKYKTDRLNAPEWLNSIGLNALELQATYGIKMPEERAKIFKENAEKYNVKLSLHAPYYINLASKNNEIVKRSISRIIDAFRLARWLGTKCIVFHPGSYYGDRERAVEKLIKNIKIIETQISVDDIYLRPEIAGKIAQLGTLDEVVTISKETKIVRPCIDFAHLHAREGGSLTKKEAFLKVFNKIKVELGPEALKTLHCHFYPVDFNGNGEKGHKKFSDVKPQSSQLNLTDIWQKRAQDNRYYPRFEPFLDALIEHMMEPTIICEAKDSQDEGALMMKEYYQSRALPLKPSKNK
jgi:deoxyribonuclease-4